MYKIDDIKNRIFCGDCLDFMKDIPDKSIDCIITDPPYNIKKAEWDKWKTKEGYIEWCGNWILECQRVLKDNGSFYFFHNDMVQISMLMEWIRKNTNFVFKSFLTIDKLDNNYIKDLYGSQEHFRNYLNIAEYCLFYTFQEETGLNQVLKQEGYYSLMKYFKLERNKLGWTYKKCDDYLGIKASYCYWDKPTTHPYRIPDERHYKKLQKTGFFKKKYEDIRKEYEDLRREYEDLRYTFNGKSGVKNVWSYAFRDDKKVKHPTQKPIKLIEDIIYYSSNENHLILDPFIGSGTTAVACINTGRNFIGIEQDERHYELSKKRIKETLEQKTTVISGN